MVAGGVPGSGGDRGQPDVVTMADRGEGLQAHGAAADRLLVVLLEHEGPDPADDRGLVRERSGSGTR